jgi:TPP-dependent pyruvate/acetoin dehydrogenase alpha subunit
VSSSAQKRSESAPRSPAPRESGALQIVDPRGRAVGDVPPLADGELRALYVHMARVRCVDQRMLKLQRAGRVGFVGSMLGLEAAMIGSAFALRPVDWLWSGLREGGAALMRGLPLAEYVAQMYCNSNDTAKGRQMCNHFQHRASHYPSWSSVIGTQIPHGVGAAHAAKLRGLDEVHAVYFGDGATSSNGFHSGLNFAGVYQVPCFFVCVDNGWAISVPSCAQTAAASYADKGSAYGVPAAEVDGNDVLACYAAARDAHAAARASRPTMIVLQTYRMLGHSSSDDPTKYRDAKEVEQWEARDPLLRYAAFLESRRILGPGDAARIEAELFAEIDRVVHEQEAAPPMPLKTLVEDVYAEVPRHLRVQYNRFAEVAEKHGLAERGEGRFPL